MGVKSKLDLIGQRINSVGQPPENKTLLQSLFDYIRPKEEEVLILTTYLPTRDFLRAESFVDDIQELIDTEISLNSVISNIFEDFIFNFRRGRIDQVTVYRNLKEQQCLIKPQEQQQPTSKHPTVQTHWAVPEKRHPRQSGGWMRVKVPARKRSIYKAELLLSNMEEMDPDFLLTVEGLMAILIIDMVNESRKGYNNKYVQRLIGQLQEAR
ncbi:hypothetical protein [Paenibacillus sp. MMO-177]|uniref:hypothetical protein n=1 Tax=Paenibacillus sp. MMO-177 TaxID=3081289 RepID=UPI0030164477